MSNGDDPRQPTRPGGPKHPRYGRRTRDRAAAVLMMIVGTVFALLASAFPTVALIGSDGLGLINGTSPAGTWGSIFAGLFLGLTASEFFTGNVTHYAGDLIRSLAERVANKA